MEVGEERIDEKGHVSEYRNMLTWVMLNSRQTRLRPTRRKPETPAFKRSGKHANDIVESLVDGGCREAQRRNETRIGVLQRADVGHAELDANSPLPHAVKYRNY